MARHSIAQEQEAWAIAKELRKLGITPEISDKWVVFRKPLPPVDLQVRILQLPDGLLAKIVPRVVHIDGENNA